MRKFYKACWADTLTFNAFKRTVQSTVKEVDGGFTVTFECPSPNPGTGDGESTLYTVYEVANTDNLFVGCIDFSVEMHMGALSALYSIEVLQDGSTSERKFLTYDECIKNLPYLD
jgi:predicted carbohydrate-binding protein with CBM5 and CBM33 domain